MMNKGIILIIIVILFGRCGKDVKVEYYDDGAIKSKSEMVNGHKQGKSYLYYPNGVVYAIHNFDSGYVYGTSSYFTKLGTLSKRITYSRSVKHGPYEIYYPSGNIHETGNYVDDVKRGKIFQFYESDSSKIKNEMYVLDTKDGDFTYYIKKYDLNGKLTSVDQPFEVILPDDTLLVGSSARVKFRFNNREYDSAIVVLGDFDNPNYVYKKNDTIEFIGKETSSSFSFLKPGLNRIRGQWIIYKKEQDADSTYEYTSFGLFEENVTVVKALPYQAGL